MKLDVKTINGSYLDINMSGEYTREDIFVLPELIKKHCKNYNYKKVLLNTKGINSILINTMDQHYIGEAFASKLAQAVKIGVLGDGELFTHFTETVAINRGATIKISDNRDELLLWLTEK